MRTQELAPRPGRGGIAASSYDGQDREHKRDETNVVGRDRRLQMIRSFLQRGGHCRLNTLWIDVTSVGALALNQ